MSASKDWIRVTNKNRCKICAHDSWCTFLADGRAACCMRIESRKLCANGGWLHWLTEDRKPSPTKHARDERERQCSWADLSQQYRAAMNGQLAGFAKQLGVSAAALERLEMGWDGDACTFPMRNEKRTIVGIRRRFPDARKLSVRGGHEGCFVPHDLHDGTLLICEGPTDTAAALTLGFEAIGRPSCQGAVKIIAAYAAGRVCVIVADSDTPGMSGARALAEQLQGVAADVATIVPADGSKDLRAWLKAGCTRDDILFAIG